MACMYLIIHLPYQHIFSYDSDGSCLCDSYGLPLWTFFLADTMTSACIYTGVILFVRYIVVIAHAPETDRWWTHHSHRHDLRFAVVITIVWIVCMYVLINPSPYILLVSHHVCIVSCIIVAWYIRWCIDHNLKRIIGLVV